MNLATYINIHNYETKDFLKKINHIIYIIEDSGQIRVEQINDSVDLAQYLQSPVLADSTETEIYIRYPQLSNDQIEICKSMNVKYGNSGFVPFKYLGE